MTIDEAIQHCGEQVQEQAKKGCYSCAEEHLQLAEWLKELKAYKENTCGDAISRQSAIFLASDLKQDLPDDERIADMVMAHNEGILEYQTQLSLLPSVTPQQRTGRWIWSPLEYNWHCSECQCADEEDKPLFRYCPMCGCKMEVEE